MVAESKCCPKCHPEDIVKNGSNRVGNPKYKCKDCGFGGVFESLRPSEETKEALLRAAQERSSARGGWRVYSGYLIKLR